MRRRDLRELFDAAADDGFTREAEKRRATVGAMFKWGMAQDIVEADPSLGLTPYDRGKPRERVLGAEEIAKLWKWLDDGGMHPATAEVLKLQLLIGCRVGEAGGMREAELWTDGGTAAGAPTIDILGVARTAPYAVGAYSYPR